MKITFILPFLEMTGGVRVVFEYANKLHKKGHEVNIVYPLIRSTLGQKFSVQKKAWGCEISFAHDGGGIITMQFSREEMKLLADDIANLV